MAWPGINSKNRKLKVKKRLLRRIGQNRLVKNVFELKQIQKLKDELFGTFVNRKKQKLTCKEENENYVIEEWIQKLIVKRRKIHCEWILKTARF